MSSVPPLTQPRQLAVLTYLLLARPRRLHARDTLIALLWPESDQEQGRHALRNVLHAVRKVIGNDHLVAGGDGLIGITPGSVSCDALEAEDHVARKEWSQALALYQGDLLAGFHVSDAGGYEEWLAEERTRLHEMMVQAAATLATDRHAAGDLTGAIRAAERRVRLAPLEEAGHRQLIGLLLQHGERAEALRVYERLEARMRSEFGAEPSRETRALTEQLKAPTDGKGGEPPRPAPEAASAKATTPAAPAPVPRHNRVGLLVAGGVALLVIASFAVTRQRPVARAPESLFVVPVVNATGDTAATWLGQGLTISLREQFRRAGWSLVPESRVRSTLQDGTAPIDAARAAGAGLLLSGVADSAEGRVRLRFTATSVANREARASTTVLVEPGELLNAELGAVGTLVGQLRPGLAADSLAAALKRGTENEAAYRFFLEGAYIWDRRFTEADMLRASARFDSALAHDPTYADALAGRARVRFALGWSGFGPVALHLAAARNDASRAVELDSTSRMALATLGAVETIRDSTASRLLLQRAIALDPDRADTWYLLGVHHVFRHDYRSAEDAFRRVTELDALTPFPWITLAGVQTCQGAFDRALATVDQWLAAPSRPELVPAFQYRRGRILLALGRWQEAVPALTTGLAAYPETRRAVAAARSSSELTRALAANADKLQTVSGNALGVGTRFHAQMTALAGRGDLALRILADAESRGDLGAAMACEDPAVHAPLASRP